MCEHLPNWWRYKETLLGYNNFWLGDNVLLPTWVFTGRNLGSVGNNPEVVAGFEHAFVEMRSWYAIHWAIRSPISANGHIFMAKTRGGLWVKSKGVQCKTMRKSWKYLELNHFITFDLDTNWGEHTIVQNQQNKDYKVDPEIFYVNFPCILLGFLWQTCLT